MKIKTVFFDFDGVIAESIHIKTDAFYKMYRDYGEDIASEVVRHHKDHGGMSRFEKFEYYHRQFLNIQLSGEQVNQLADTFSSMVKQGVVDAAEVTGVRSFLEDYYQSMNFWVVSGTPHDEIRDIVQRKQMALYFKDVYGSPQKKNVWVEMVMRENRLEKETCVFVGDARSDYNAAVDNQIRFILRETPEGIPLFKDIPVPRFTVFSQFREILEQM